MSNGARISPKLLVAGGGIGGLAAVLACAQRGLSVQLLEQASAFGEVGAGVQLGPNVVRLLNGWGLADALSSVAAFPAELRVRSATSAQVLGVLPLGRRAVQTYGAAYATIARADLHGLLLDAVRRQPGVALHLDSRVAGMESDSAAVTVRDAKGQTFTADALIGADGVWSLVRQLVVDDAPPRVTGHLAYRAMVRQSDLPAALRSQVITAWMGPRFHAVQYPVKSGDWLNVVVIVQGGVGGDVQSWDHSANAVDLQRHLAGACEPLRLLVEAIADWRLWPLCDRAPMQSALEHARGRVALLGDAAHPMRPYLAQGAGMAIEDAHVLAQSLALTDDVVQALQHYANARWQRNARVQARAIRNGEIFHMQGLMRSGRDMSLKLLGARLLDVPWLYRGVQ
jgi:salicylate hydroxylase